MPAIIPTPAPAMDKSAQWCGVRRSENRGLARRNRVGHKRPPSSEALSASHSALPPDLGRWEKTGLFVHGAATVRSRASAARVEGTVNSSRECVMAFIKRHRIAVFFVLAYALAFLRAGRPAGCADRGDADRGPERAQGAGPECQPDRDTEP